MVSADVNLELCVLLVALKRFAALLGRRCMLGGLFCHARCRVDMPSVYGLDAFSMSSACDVYH